MAIAAIASDWVPKDEKTRTGNFYTDDMPYAQNFCRLAANETVRREAHTQAMRKDPVGTIAKDISSAVHHFIFG